MSERLNQLLQTWMTEDTPATTEPPQWIAQADELEISGLILFLHSIPPHLTEEQRRNLDQVLNLLAVRLREEACLDSPQVEKISETYIRWGAEHPLRHLLLALLTNDASDESLETFAELIVTDPPNRAAAAAVAFVPLLRRDDYQVDTLFPRLLDGLGALSVAALILDLANFLYRGGRVAKHPVVDQKKQMVDLLSGLVGRLSKLEEQTPTTAEEVLSLKHQVGEAVPVALSVCDALAAIGDPEAIPALMKASDLAHRRLRCEAGVALARLGEQAGVDLLVKLAEQPICRPRVLEVAGELDFLTKIGPQYTSEAAQAEATLVVWLSAETQFGLAPQELELVDSRKLLWPGYDEPQTCYLLRYGYHLPQGSFSSVGIVGPVTQSFAVDLTSLAPLDIYAAYAGWHVDHPEIFEIESSRWEASQNTLASHLRERMEKEGYQEVTPYRLGYFLGDVRLIATGRLGAEIGTIVADMRTTSFYPRLDPNRPLGAGEAYCIHKGRELLYSFNPELQVKAEGTE